MPNLSQVIKAEIIRLSRKEIKSSVNPLRSSNVVLRHALTELKRKFAQLEVANKQLMTFVKKEQEKAPQIIPEEIQKARFTSKTIKKMREKLDVSQDSFAKLLGVSTQAVYAMEHKQGRIKLRPGTLTSLLSVRGMGKREAQDKLNGFQAAEATTAGALKKKSIKKAAKKK
jgi:DNA-binding transcriptional regulator YiaG